MPNNKTAVIRQEQPSDYKIIHKVVKKAFESTEHSDGNEQELVIMLRKSEAYIPELSLVAEIDSSIVGHIMFTRAKVGDESVLALAPLSVLPEYQNKGIGKALISAGHHIAKKLGYQYSVVLGSETYYPKSGYIPASRFGIIAPFDVPDKNFMAFKLDDSAPVLCGRLKYDKAFGIE